ncbi:MAG: GNAT family N-acetyltransferase [Woeseiaceae bacterium]
MKAPTSFQSARLLFRKPGQDDAESIFQRYAGDPDIGEFLAWPIHRSVDDTRRFLEFSDAEWQQSPAGPYLLFSREDARLLGSTGLAFESPQCASTGYVLARDAWGVGYAEALGEMQQLSSDLGVERLFALCHPGHAPSIRVLEKCSFGLEGTIRQSCVFPNRDPGILADVVSYSWCRS